ncbi:hypothetical protein M407DRAFT_202469 [Tulasnella calospora MUT 4182]|uniref:18S rRNA (guanine(1575)-N(7))-methyltransferase Bud23 C-terminal domain-containing protein n=1 Tax=Tulasnella calospora MUT 4182 TaxID=1051891 RepID=A0A0C3KXU6_9AGAM|nr:hypothetical protein M407DRAFT_202469 [Tulasnella calospora MUT 4182]
MSRPEFEAPPEIYYGDEEAKKYTSNTRNQEIQAQMTDRALELLSLPPGPAMLLDIGCGSGLSGEILDEEGHVWVGVDIAPSMLEVALEREVEGDLFLQDIGQGFGFRPGSFDGAISISVLQWLCNADTTSPTSSPYARLTRFFTTLHASLSNGSKAVFQFYPQNDDQIQLIMGVALKAGFTGGLVVDYPNSKKAKKYFLCLFVGGSVPGKGRQQQLPQGLTGEPEGIQYEKRRTENSNERGRKDKKRRNIKDKEWILKKKDLYRRRGKEDVPRDSKYTGRRRKPIF